MDEIRRVRASLVGAAGSRIIEVRCHGNDAQLGLLFSAVMNEQTHAYAHTYRQKYAGTRTQGLGNKRRRYA